VDEGGRDRKLDEALRRTLRGHTVQLHPEGTDVDLLVQLVFLFILFVSVVHRAAVDEREPATRGAKPVVPVVPVALWVLFERRIDAPASRGQWCFRKAAAAESGSSLSMSTNFVVTL
jgi:1-acyl-sn-glycerol-3-phosphate acyltransferase